MALDKEVAAQTLFGNYKKQPEKPLDPIKQAVTTAATPKAVYDKQVSNTLQDALERITVPLSIDQKEGLDRVAKKIMRNRSKGELNRDDRERITANTLIRVLIDNFLAKESSFDLAVINTEDEARAWIKKVIEG